MEVISYLFAAMNFEREVCDEIAAVAAESSFDIMIYDNEKCANAKKPEMIVSLGIKLGDEIKFVARVKSADEAEQAAKLFAEIVKTELLRRVR